MRYWAKSKKQIYVYTGAVFQQKDKAGKTIIKKIIGNGVAVPTAFFKIIYSPDYNQAIAFLMPNTRVEKNKIAGYRTSIKNIEKLTGLEFLLKLPTAKRAPLVEKTSKMW